MFFMPDELNPVNDLVKAHIAKNATNTGGENSEKKDAVVIDDGKKKDDLPPPANPLEDVLKEFNLESIDQLKERLKPKVEDKKLEESPEEKEKRENVYKSNLLNYAVENSLMKPDDFVKLENIKSKADRDLVFEKFAAEQKEDNPDITDAEITENFESEYKLNSENAKAKTRGENRLKKEASEMRTPLESSFNTAKTKFDEERTIRNNYPAFDKTVRGFVSDSIPAKFEVYKGKDGEEDVLVDVELTADEKKEISENVAKKLQNTATYLQFTKGETQALKDLAKKETENFIWDKYRNKNIEAVATSFKKRGIAQASIGAKNPFPLADKGGNSGAGGGAAGNAKERVLESMKNKK